MAQVGSVTSDVALLLEAFACPAALFDDDRVIYANAGARVLLGLRKSDITRGDISPDLSAAPSLLHVIRASLDREGACVPHTALGPDGTFVQVEIGARPFLNQGRELVLVVAHDVSARLASEASLRLSEERFRTLYEDNPSMYFTVDETGVVLSVNKFGAEQLDYAPEELVGRPVLDVFHPEDRERLRGQLAECLAAPGRAMSWECRKVRRDGSILWVREDARTAEMGHRKAVLIVCENITTRKAIEEMVRQARDELEQRVVDRTKDLTDQRARLLHEIERRVGAERRLSHERDLLHVLLDNLSEHIYFKDTASRYVRISRSLARFYGLTEPASAVGKSDSDFYPPEDAQAYRADEEAVLRSGQRMTKVESCRQPSGETRFFLTTKAPLRDPAGRITGIFGISRDVTESRLAEQRLRSLLDGTPEAMVIVDRDGAIVHGSARVVELFGYAAMELPNSTFEDLVANRDRARVHGMLRSLVEPSHPARVTTLTVYGRKKCGSTFPMEISLGAIETEDGRFVAASLRDVTERRNVEKRINDSVEHEQRRIGQEVHDTLGQQVTGMLMLASSLQRKLAGENPANANLIAALVMNIEEAQSQVRDISRGLIPVEVDANGLMSALIGLADWTQKLHKVRCTFECGAPVPIEDNFTATHLYRIAQEAIRNSVKHAEPSTIVTSLRDADGFLTLTVEDDGKGLTVDPESVEGMGLRIMRYRAGLIGATLDIQSSPGEGTVVTCTLASAAS